MRSPVWVTAHNPIAPSLVTLSCHSFLYVRLDMTARVTTLWNQQVNNPSTKSVQFCSGIIIISLTEGNGRNLTNCTNSSWNNENFVHLKYCKHCLQQMKQRLMSVSGTLLQSKWENCELERVLLVYGDNNVYWPYSNSNCSPPLGEITVERCRLPTCCRVTF